MASKKYKNKYRIASTRLPYWDYRSNASYFITLCTVDREHFFGEITNRKMELSETGLLAEKYWLEIPEHYRFIQLDAHIIMPNHIHGIITISKSAEEIASSQSKENQYPSTYRRPNRASQPSPARASTPNKERTIPASQKWQPNSLGSIINQYKRTCTINARKTLPQFAWQPRYYDHIIRNKTAYWRIKNYIINNPKNWKKDIFS